METAVPASSPRERLLAAADELFYEEGICSVGINRVIEHAGVARASLYSLFGSKDELVREYLRRRSETWQVTTAEVLPDRWETPREQLLGVFTLLGEWFEVSDYRGCPFINASAEETSSAAVADVRDAHREWVRSLFADLAGRAGAADPTALSAQLVLLYDGSMVGAQLDRSPAPGQAARAAAASLLDSAT
jgi:AcrR family transcriptional regulator